MTEWQPTIVVWGQWILFVVGTVAGIWGTGYLLWMSSELSDQWSAWLLRRRDRLRSEAEIELQFFKAAKELEFETLRLTEEMKLRGAKAQADAMNSAMAPEVEDSGPMLPPIKLKRS